jgi:predicted nucleotide-binding protein (sugar kinase/HSP70/actin superfamily)
MRTPTLPKWFAKARSAEAAPKRRLRIGIPRVLSQWSTHRFWIALFTELGVRPRDIVFSSETSEAQQREFGQGRGAVDCCYPVKCLAGHYGELLQGQKRKIDVLFSPMISSLPSFMRGHVTDDISCPRVMAAPENAKAGFLREKDVFAELDVRHVAPLVSMAEPALAAKQLHEGLMEVFPDLTRLETEVAVARAYAALEEFNERLRVRSREVLENCARENRPCLLVLGRPYHMDPGIGHDIESELQAHGYPVLWGQHLPVDTDILGWLFGADVAAERLHSPYDISDIWPSSYSANTNEMFWAARYGARMPWIACTIRFASYECGMDQPTYTPVQAITERSGTLYFAFQDLDATKPAGSVRIRVETIAYYLAQRADEIIARKLACLRPHPWLQQGAA